MKDMYLKITKNINTKEIMTEFYHNYQRIIITNDYNTLIGKYRYKYYIILDKNIPAGNYVDYDIISFSNNNSISLTDLKNENLKSAYNFCDQELRSKQKDQPFRNNKEIHFDKALLIRYQTIEDEWGYYRGLAIVGVKIVDNNYKQSHEIIAFQPRVKRMNTYYLASYNGYECKIYFDEANNVQKAIDVFNQRYKKRKNI